MKDCDFCGTTIVFGGIKDEGLSFCCKECHSKVYRLIHARKSIPNDLIIAKALEVTKGKCPHCHGEGPIDVHTSYRVLSFIFFTSWKSIPKICCKSCGVKSQIGNCLLSFLFGWWGFPWGIIITPIQIVKNLRAILKNTSINVPSDSMKNIVRNLIAEEIIQQQQQQHI